MIRQSYLTAENDNCKLSIIINLDDKDKPGANTGVSGRVTNHIFEQLMEWFNANELKVISYAKEIKGGKKTA